MGKSLKRLLGLIDQGWEFPDARSRVSRDFKVCEDDLAAQYDQHFLDATGRGAPSFGVFLS